jgi:hypothetical protein
VLSALNALNALVQRTQRAHCAQRAQRNALPAPRSAHSYKSAITALKQRAHCAQRAPSSHSLCSLNAPEALPALVQRTIVLSGLRSTRPTRSQRSFVQRTHRAPCACAQRASRATWALPCTSRTRTSTTKTFRRLSTPSSARPGLPPGPKARRLVLELSPPDFPPLAQALRRHHGNCRLQIRLGSLGALKPL